MSADERLGRRPLEERSRLGVYRAAREVGGRGVSDVELDRGVEGHELDKIGRAERTGLLRWRVLKRKREEKNRRKQ